MESAIIYKHKGNSDMNKDEVSKKVKKLSSEILKLQKEVEDIQSSCSHKEYRVGIVKDRKGRNSSPRRVCKKCDAIIGFPNKQDLEDNGYA